MEAKTHQMRLHLNPFEGILGGSQRIESRLYDKKRREVEVGDDIEFILRDNPERKFKAKVVELLRFSNFNELYSASAPEDFGVLDKKDYLTSVYSYYSKEDEEKYGVVGIRLVELGGHDKKA